MRSLKLFIPLIVAMLLITDTLFLSRARTTNETAESNLVQPEPTPTTDAGFEVNVLVNGVPVEQYASRGRRYIEAIQDEEYAIRIRNPLNERVAVALSVDGLNTIDARRTTAYNASKWVIGPYQTITVHGWQMSSSRARHFYFTTERESYGASIGQTANLGVISAVFFRERRRTPIVILPPPRRPDTEANTSDRRERSDNSGQASAAEDSRRESRSKNRTSIPPPDDESAATGIGRNVRNDVRWVEMELNTNPSAEVTIRYEYRAALVRLGILPRNDSRVDTLRRRERSSGFEDRRYSPEP